MIEESSEFRKGDRVAPGGGKLGIRYINSLYSKFRGRYLLPNPYNRGHEWYGDAWVVIVRNREWDGTIEGKGLCGVSFGTKLLCLEKVVRRKRVLRCGVNGLMME